MDNDKFSKLIEASVAPIYFFNNKQKPILGGNQNTTHGTLTLYRKSHIVLGITNYHVYKECTQDKICQIGNSLRINLQERLIHEDQKNDLVVIFFNAEDIQNIGSKGGFKKIVYDISEVLDSYQKDDNPRTWACHIVGFSGKETTELTPEVRAKILHRPANEITFQENFDACPYICHSRFCPEKNEITLNLSKTREAVEKGLIEDIKEFPKHFSLRGISGGPVFALIEPYQDQLSLLGIIYEGCEEEGMEVVKARPISLLKNVIEKATL